MAGVFVDTHGRLSRWESRTRGREVGEQMVVYTQARTEREADRLWVGGRGSSGEKKDKGTRSRSSSDDEKRFVNSNTRPCRLPKRPVTFRATISA